MKRPVFDNAPGLVLKPRKRGFEARWEASKPAVRAGYQPKSVQVWVGIFPTDADREFVSTKCQRFDQWEREWLAARVPKYDGAWSSLIACYQTDPDSTFAEVRDGTRKGYIWHLKKLKAAFEADAVASMTGRRIKQLHREWKERNGVATAHARIRMIQIVLSFGASILEDDACKRLKGIIEEMEFQAPRRRKAILTREHVIAICRVAHEKGEPEIAFAQALQWPLGVRQKDVLGEWIPQSDPGISEIVEGDEKWVIGFHWREVTDALVMTHRISKSLRGKAAVADPEAGNQKIFYFDLYPMIMDEIARIPPEDRVGPMIVDHKTGLPFRAQEFRKRWREIATAAGVPKEVQNRDSRAGMATAADHATGGNRSLVQKSLGHAQLSTTGIYVRDEDRATAEVAVLMSKKE